MEAMEAETDSAINFEAVNSQKMKISGSGRIGSTGKGIALNALSLCVDNSCSIYYRVCLKNIGWTAFSCDGQLCGVREITEKNASVVIEGIQIVYVETSDQKEDQIQRAEAELERYQSLKSRLFVNNKFQMLERTSKNYTKSGSPDVHVLEEGMILPLKKINLGRNGVFVGGVCDRTGKFVAGHSRKTGKKMNLSCVEGYVPEDSIYDDSEVIYGGIMIGFFGHALTECTSRLWWILQNTGNQDRIAVLKAPGTGNLSTQFFELAGIPPERMVLVEKPTRFKKVIVPEQSILLWEYVYPREFLLTYDRIREHIPPAPYKKLYLTRTRFKKQDGINEEYFEDFYERRGYKVIELEEYPMEEQIAILKGAQEIVCTIGTLSHMALFCNSGTSLTIINRVTGQVLLPQILINQARNLNVNYMDATFNFLPTVHVCGPSLYGPTKLFVEYLNENQIEYEEKEVQIDLSLYAMDYVEKWLETYTNEKNFNEISGLDMFRVIESMNEALEKPPLKKKFKSKLQEKIDKLTEENKSGVNK
jgi:hypothetical protein